MNDNSSVHKLEKEIRELRGKLDNLEKEHLELQDRESLYRVIFKNAEVPVTLLDFELNKLVEFNTISYKSLGYSKEEFRDLYFFDFVEPVSMDLNETRKGSNKFECRVKAKNGEERDIMVYSRPVEIKEKLYALAAAVDITEQKKAETALRDSEEFSFSLLKKSPIPILVIDEELKVKYINPMLEKLTGYEKKEIIGTTAPFPWWPDRDEDGSGVKSWNETVFAGIDKFETNFKNRQGDTFYVIITVTPIKKDGKFKYALISWVDITARRHAEDEEKELREQYERAQRMEALGTLAGGIAHDFNNLLMGVLGRTSMMLLDKIPEDPDCKHLREIEEYVKNAADLAGQLLGFARGGKYEISCIDPNRLIDTTAGMFGRTKKEIHIHKRLDKRLWNVEADQGQINQVLMNIFINAWQAMPGGGRLYINTENIEVRDKFSKLKDLKPGKYVKITITDTGTGMSKEVMDRIFEPFFTTKERGRGTGLGMASAYGIISNHGGLIDVYSREGEGSTFRVYLPASEKSAEIKKEISGEITCGDETILLIDDEDIIIDVGRSMLEKLGYDVFTAKSGREAVNLFRGRKTEISLIILDMIMPDMNGNETFDHLKKIDPDVNVLLSSGYSVDEKANEIMLKGCKGFIQKPFNLKTIAQKVREIIDTRK